MKAYYHDNKDDEDFRLPHDSGEELSLEKLAQIGVLYFHLETQQEVDQVAQERSYKNRDVINLDELTFPGGKEVYHDKLVQFYKEHLHEDEEIRYILDGEGYFDVRDDQDRWIRTLLSPGDLLILPAGIYHRFTLTQRNYVKLLRLFKDEPKWTALNRPVEENPYRQEYLNSIKL